MQYTGFYVWLGILALFAVLMFGALLFALMSDIRKHTDKR